MKYLLIILLLLFSMAFSLGESTKLITVTKDISIIQNRSDEEKSLWEGWKRRYTKILAGGNIIVDPWAGKAFSEAMGHALLLSVQFNDQKYFNLILSGLDEYFTNKHGLYCWEIRTDGRHFDDKSKEISASETELNVLMALLQAGQLIDNHIWEKNKKLDYRTFANKLEEKIWQYEIISHQKYTVLLPSDDKDNMYWPVMYQNKEIYKIAWAPTYFNPAYLKIFAKYYPKHDWNSVIDNGYDISNQIIENYKILLENDKHVQGKNPIPAWVWIIYDNLDNSTRIENYFKGVTYEGATYSNEYDSIRVPMYVGLDYLWNRDIRSNTFIKKLVRYSGVDKVEKSRIGASEKSPEGFYNTMAISQYAIANMVAGEYTEFADYINKKVNTDNGYIGDSAEANYYYNQTFALYSYLILNKRFIKIM